ncbi:unnamed protein product [Caenorhabditis sp. 36 PRJEB53466]|nr:unnamed protein product [Caenorhabditis sp. 36 PRJEB53466]
MGRKNKGKSVAEPVAKQLAVINLSIGQLETFCDKLLVVQAGKYNWTVHVYRGVFFRSTYLVFDLYCHCSQSNWSLEAEALVSIAKKTSHRMEHHFENKRNCVACPPLIAWADLIDPANGYLDGEGNVDFEVDISEVPKKVWRNAAAISKEYPGIRNLEINVGKSKFFLNKELLAHTSVFFNSELEKGKFKENEAYILEEISPMDFKLYLDLVYLPKQYFSAYCAKDMLEVANRFQNTEIVMTCQNVILEDLKENKLSSKDKAKLAEVYDLATVKELFKPEALVPHSRRPRFMAPEDPRNLSEDMDLGGFFPPTIIHKHLETCPIGQIERNQEEEEEEEEEEGGGGGVEEEEEEFDQTIPSTSGLTNY